MKGFMKLMLSALILLSSGAYAAATNMDGNWICTTNASTATTDADKTADKQMADTAKSAADSFTYAASNCRDCTKITCEVKAP